MVTRCTIVPPYLLETLARCDDPGLAAAALHTRSLDERHREGRRTATPTATPAPTSPHRSVYNAGGSTDLPGTLRRQEGGDATGDQAVDDGYDHLGATWTFYARAYDRDSVDGQAMPLVASVHYGDRYDNAFWNGEQMVFGDGDGTVFLSFTGPLDVTAHELTHGVTQYTANLAYENQPGALNESVSDVFGSLVKQYTLGQTADRADWLIGEGLFAPGVNGEALRSLAAPGTAYDDPRIGRDPQAPTMDGYQDTTEDNGGVHLNSGIPNHAFYLAATALGGNAWEGAGLAWYRTLTGGTLPQDADFATFAQATVDHAVQLGADVGDAVAGAWQQVKVLPSDTWTSDTGTSDTGTSGVRVIVRRSGGFAGLVREGSVEASVQQAHTLVAALRTAPAGARGVPDAFVYQVVVDDREWTVTEDALPDQVRALVRAALGAG